MFLGVNGGGFMGVGNLINANAISTLKANAYQAAKVVLGRAASEEALMKAADDYAAFVIPRTNRALNVGEIVRDFNFKRIATGAKSEASVKGKVSKLIDTHDWSLGGSIFGNIPNLLLYGAAGYVGYRYYNKRKGGSGKGFFKSLFGKRKTSRRKTSRRRTSYLAPPPPVIGA